MNVHRSVRPNVLNMAGYVPGEQPDPGQTLIKLNTNENPFGPPPSVVGAVLAAAEKALQLYPEPTCRAVREAAAKVFGILPQQVVVGNGSDDILTMILRTFIDPGEIVAAPVPTYTLYAALTDLQGGRFIPVPWAEDFRLPVDRLVETGAKVIFVVRPNAPTGHAVALDDVSTLCQRAKSIVVLDEAYADFADDNGLQLLATHENLLITRTFSKSMALAALRIGLGFMSAELTLQLHKVRDSYNVNRLSQAAAVAALTHRADYQPLIQSIRLEREQITLALRQRGFTVPASQANFILATVPQGGMGGAAWARALKENGVLIRYFGSDPYLADKLRITIGRSEEMQRFLQVVDHILAS